MFWGQQNERRASKNVRPLLVKAGASVGLVGIGTFGSSAELLVEVDGVTYRLSADVNHDD